MKISRKILNRLCLDKKLNRLHGLSGLILLYMISGQAVWADNSVQHGFSRPGTELPELPEFIEPDASSDFKFEALEKVLPAQALKPVYFKLKGLDFSGNQVISDERLLSAVQPYLGKLIELSELEDIRLALTRVYKDAGYLNSGAVLDDQHIADGIVHYTLIEGYLESVQITNAEDLSDQYIIDQLVGDPEMPVQGARLQQNFQRLLQHPLIDQIQGSLKPGSQPGASVLDLDIRRSAEKYGAYLGVDNQTPPSIGAYTGRVGGYYRNINGYADLAAIEFGFSEGLQMLNFNYTTPLNRHNTEFSVEIQASQSKIIEKPFNRLNIESDFLHVAVKLMQPVFQSVNREFKVGLSYAYRINQTYLNGVGIDLNEGAESNGETKVSVLRFIQDYSQRTENSALSLRSIFNVGVDVLGATVSRQPVNAKFFSWIGQMQYAQKLHSSGLQWLLRGRLQLADDRLLSLEQFALGGFYSLRGYRENTQVKDQGYSVSSELHIPVLKAAQTHGLKLNVIPFFDIGAAWNSDQSVADPLYSAGIGLKADWRSLTAQLFWAHGFTGLREKADYDLQDDGVHFQLSSRVL